MLLERAAVTGRQTINRNGQTFNIGLIEVPDRQTSCCAKQADGQANDSDQRFEHAETPPHESIGSQDGPPRRHRGVSCRRLRNRRISPA